MAAERDAPQRAGRRGDEPPSRTDVSLNALQMEVRPLDPENIPPRKQRTDADREDEHGAVARRLRWFLDQREYPGDSLDPEGVRNAFRESVDLEARTSFQPSVALASASQWQLLGPGNFAGRVNAIAVDYSNSQTIYVCTASAGVWRSMNGGTNWTDIGAGLGTNFTGAVTVDFNNASVVYVGTGDPDFPVPGIGLFKSVNRGNTFSMTGLPAVAWISRVVVQPGNSNIVYAATSAGLYKSTDAGTTWSRLWTGQINDLVMHPSSPMTLYWGQAGAGIYKSTDGGATRTLQIGRPTDPFGRARLAMCLFSPDTLYASFDVNGTVEMWKTTNGGSAWTKLASPPQAGWGQLWYNHYIAVRPNNANIVYSGQGTIYRSSNGGTTWTEIHEALGTGYTTIHVDHHCLTFDPSNPAAIYCGCDGGVYRSRFAGNFWEYIGASIPSAEFYAIGLGTSEHYEIGGGTQDNGTWLTDGAYDRWRHILGGDGFQFVVDPTDANRLYAEWQNVGVNRSDDRGASFAAKDGGFLEADPRPWVGVIELDPSNPSRLYAGTDRIYRTDNRMDAWTRLSCGDNVVLISLLKGAASRVEINANSTASAALGLAGQVSGKNDDAGNPQSFARMQSSRRAPFALTAGMTLRVRVDGGAWQTVTFQAPQFTNIAAATAREVAAAIDTQTNNLHAGASAVSGFTAIKVAPSAPTVIYAAATAQLWRSLNGGATWESIVRPPLPNRWITDIDVESSNFLRVWISMSGAGTAHAFFSPDGGGTWTARSTGLPDTPASSILIDPVNANRLWLGTDQGVYRTIDGGMNWARYSTNLPRVVVTDLKLHRNTGLLRAGTYGRGVWEIDATDVSISLSGIRTASQSAADTRLFRRTQDALTIIMDVAASAELVALNLTFDAFFQILDARTNKIVVQQVTSSPFLWGQFFWISRGNNWAAPFDTPERWGLNAGLYLFRAAITVRNANAFTMPRETWFRVI